MSKPKLYQLFGIIIATFGLIALPLTSQAAPKSKGKAVQQTQKERLVLMPLRLGEEDQKLQGIMESALVDGLQQKYTVLWGEEVEKKAKEIFHKENLKHECNEERCMQGIAEAFQSELLATVIITKQEGGYFLSITIQNLYDHVVVFTRPLQCRGCDSFQVVDKLKELGIAAAPPIASPEVAAVEAPQIKINPADPESALWGEVQKGNTADDYAAYLAQYPKGKFVALAKSRAKKLQEQAAAELAQQDQNAWDAANAAATEDAYQNYLRSYPQGRYVGLVSARINKLRGDAALREEQAMWDRVQNSEDSKVVQNFLDRYPNGSHFALAQQRLADIKKAEAEMRPGKVFKDCPDCPEMVILPAGSFIMGTSREDDEGPVHRVAIRESFAMGRMEITRGQFAAFVAATGYDAGNQCYVLNDDRKWEGRTGINWRYPGYQQDDSHPVACLGWNDAKAYVEWLARKTGKPYHLPSEAQWEYGCYAGSQSEYCGSDNINSVSWYGATSGVSSHPVGLKQANAFGLYDMSGNIWESVEDSYHTSYNGAPNDGSAWTDNSEKHVLRGGSWHFAEKFSRSAFRNNRFPNYRYDDGGFRVARRLQ